MEAPAITWTGRLQKKRARSREDDPSEKRTQQIMTLGQRFNSSVGFKKRKGYGAEIIDNTSKMRFRIRMSERGDQEERTHHNHM